MKQKQLGRILFFVLLIFSIKTFSQEPELNEESKEFQQLDQEFQSLDSEIQNATPSNDLSLDELDETPVAEPTAPSPEVVEEETLDTSVPAEEPNNLTFEEELESEIKKENAEVPNDKFNVPTEDAPQPEFTAPNNEWASKPSSDEPDEELEARMARIYNEFYSRKISDAEWFQMAGPKTSETYNVQNGDTLWGISTTFFGNGFFWPKLWQLNSGYTNPHILEPRQSIHFSAGSLSEEPHIFVASNEMIGDKDPPLAHVTPAQARAYEANVRIPPPPRRMPVLQELPPSLPVWHTTAMPEKDSFEILQGRTANIKEDFLVTSTAMESIPDGEGQIVEVETGENIAQLYQEVVIHSETVKEGETYIAFKATTPLVTQFYEGKVYPVNYGGEVEILEVLSEGRARALVTRLVGRVDVGSHIIKGHLPMSSYATKGAPNGTAELTILGTNMDEQTDLVGAGSIIYLLGGIDHNVKPGELLTIFKNNEVHNPESLLKELREPIGLLKVISVTEGVTTGLILESRDEIRPGDRTGSGAKF